MKTNAQWCFFIALIGLQCTEQAGDIRKPPKIINSPKRENTFRNGDSKTLDCKAEGIPEVTYEWRKGGSSLNLNLPRITKGADGSITIEGLTKADEGVYQCMARNQYGTAMSDLTLLRMAFLQTTPGVPEEMTFTEDEPFHLETTPPKSYPQPTFSWEIAISNADPNPRTLSTSSRIQIDEDGNLHFACAKSEDELGGRIYKSTSFNAFTDERKANNYAKVTIRPVNGASSTAPQLGFSSENETIAIVGRPFTLRCFFNGCPEPTVSWESPAKAARDRKPSPNKFDTEFKLDSVTKDHEGIYRCSGQNSVRTTHTINVRVDAEPKFNEQSDAPRDINITEGETITINCTASAKPDADVTWYKNGQPINRDSLPQKFNLTNGGKSLMIRDVCKDCPEPDLAVIQCNASNVHGYAFASGYINVLKRTEVAVSGDLNVSVEIGKENVFTFSCTVKSDPITVAQAQWYKRTEGGYHVLLPSVSYPNATLEGSTLTIRFPSDLNGTEWLIYIGEYFCVGDNQYRRSNKSVFVSYYGPVPTPPPKDPPNILLIIVLAAVLVFLVLLAIILCCCWYWRGEVYEVDKMEVKTDRDLKQELLDADFQEFWRPGKQDRKGSNASQVSFGRMTPTDGASLNEYNFDDVGQFAEDGSFVGNYKDIVV